jgi:hypothetical protein
MLFDNDQAKKCREILKKHGGFRQDSFKRPVPPGIVRNCDFELWAVPQKGSVILQIWADGHGCTTYANWPMGETYDELDAFLGVPRETFKSIGCK